MSSQDPARVRRSDRIPAPEQLDDIRFQARRLIDVRRRQLQPRRPGEPSSPAGDESVALRGLKGALDASEARCPYGWSDPVRDALTILVREVAPGPPFAGGSRGPMPIAGPYGLRWVIPAPRPIPRGKSAAQRLNDLDALEAAVAELEKAVDGDSGDDPQVANSPREAGPGQPVVPSREDPVEEAIRLVGDSPRAVDLLRYLNDRPGRRATLDEIAKSVHRARVVTEHHRRTVRRGYNRAQALLNETDAPVSLSIDKCVVRLVVFGRSEIE